MDDDAYEDASLAVSKNDSSLNGDLVDERNNFAISCRGAWNHKTELQLCNEVQDDRTIDSNLTLVDKSIISQV